MISCWTNWSSNSFSTNYDCNKSGRKKTSMTPAVKAQQIKTNLGSKHNTKDSNKHHSQNIYELIKAYFWESSTSTQWRQRLFAGVLFTLDRHCTKPTFWRVSSFVTNRLKPDFKNEYNVNSKRLNGGWKKTSLALLCLSRAGEILSLIKESTSSTVKSCLVVYVSTPPVIWLLVLYELRTNTNCKDTTQNMYYSGFQTKQKRPFSSATTAIIAN